MLAIYLYLIFHGTTYPSVRYSSTQRMLVQTPTLEVRPVLKAFRVAMDEHIFDSVVRIQIIRTSNSTLVEFWKPRPSYTNEEGTIIMEELCLKVRYDKQNGVESWFAERFQSNVTRRIPSGKTLSKDCDELANSTFQYLVQHYPKRLEFSLEMLVHTDKSVSSPRFSVIVTFYPLHLDSQLILKFDNNKRLVKAMGFQM